MISPSRVHRAAELCLAAFRAGVTHPVGLLTFLLREAAAYEQLRTNAPFRTTPVSTVDIERHLAAFFALPPRTLLPSLALAELGYPPCPVDILTDSGDRSELPLAEQRVVLSIVSALKPSTIFEIGTYRGRTTRLLARSSPQATVHTLDLPPDRMLAGGCFQRADEALIGVTFAGDSPEANRIIQHYGDSRTFDFSPFHNGVDFVFVDASHAYEAVLNDTERAFLMLRPGGAILWDDYHPVHGPGVMRALAEVSAGKPLVWITGTRLALYRSPALGTRPTSA